MARRGINPEKLNPKQLNYKLHRVIIPFYIPNVTEEYYKESVAVLDLCLKSFERENIMLKKGGEYKKINRFHFIPYWIKVKSFQIVRKLNRF